MLITTSIYIYNLLCFAGTTLIITWKDFATSFDWLGECHYRCWYLHLCWTNEMSDSLKTSESIRLQEDLLYIQYNVIQTSKTTMNIAASADIKQVKFICSLCQIGWCWLVWYVHAISQDIAHKAPDSLPAKRLRMTHRPEATSNLRIVNLKRPRHSAT